jgi:outer membrane protein insertion porin family
VIVPTLVLVIASTGANASAPQSTIATVSIEADDAVARKVAPYVSFKPGERLSVQAIRETVELIHATGGFADVIVETEETDSGVEVSIRPLPAPRMAGVRVTGSKALSARSVQRIARLNDGEILWPTRIRRAVAAVEESLRQRGYLDAKVSGSVADSSRGPHAVFDVQTGPRFRLGRVVLEGAGDADAVLAEVSRPRVGTPFRRDRAGRAAEDMRKRLAEEGHFEAQVDLREAIDRERSLVTLTYDIRPGAATRIEFVGGDLSARLRGDVETLLRDGSFRADVVDDAVDRVESALRKRGHRDAAVSVHREDSGPEQAVRFEAREGPLAMVASVRIEGDPTRSLGTILTTRPLAPLEDRVVQEDVRALTRALEARGYAEARVEADVADGGGDLPVVFRVRAGPQTLVRRVVIDATDALKAESVPQELRLRAGAPFRFTDVSRDRGELLSACRNAGFLGCDVAPDISLSVDRSAADVTFRVRPGAQARVGRIVVAGLSRTREQVVRRELLLKEGAPLGLRAFLDSQRRLVGLGLFRTVDLTETGQENRAERTVVAAVTEARTTTVVYGLGYSERDRIRGSVEVTRRNLSGMDRTLSMFARASAKGSRLYVTFREPYLLGRRQELFATGFREEDNRESFSFVRYGGLLQAAKNVSSQWNLILRQVYQKTFVFDVVGDIEDIDRQYRNYTVSGPSFSVVNDTRDDPLDPHRGWFLSGDLQTSFRVIGGESFVKGYFQAALYRRATSRVVLAYNARLGLARTFGAGEPLVIPAPERFFAGGDFGPRGFKVDTVGPRVQGSSGVWYPTGGNALLLGSVEVRVDAARRLSLAGFTDIGNVYTLVSDLDLSALRYTAGLGIRYRSAIGPLRLDWGYKLNRVAGESPYRFHVTIGHAF